MTALRIIGLPGHRRAYLFGRRAHHGLTGAVLIGLGAVLCWHDRKDCLDWWPK